MITVNEFVKEYLSRAHTKDVVMVTIPKYTMEELIGMYATLAIEECHRNSDNILSVKEKL